MFTERDIDIDVDEDEMTEIILENETIEITTEGIFLLSGSISDGQIVINVAEDEKVQLVLNNISVTNSDGAAIYVTLADKVFITSIEDSINTFTSNNFSNLEIDGVIYSKDDLTFNGSGTINIVTPSGHGIVCNDDLVFAGGKYNIISENHGIKANDSIKIADGTFNVDCGKDAIKADNTEEQDLGFIYIENGTFNLDAGFDGFSSSSVLEIIEGDFTISTGGGFSKVLNSITVGEGSSGVQETDKIVNSMRAMKCNGIYIMGGTFELSSYEDAIHSNEDLFIYGGTLNILSGDDAVHADEHIVIYDGDLVIENSYEGIEAANITIYGGNIDVTCLDDGINVNSSNGLLTISGGYIYVYCQGDGIDLAGDFAMTDGVLILEVDAIYTGGDGEFDIEGEISYTGGEIYDEKGNELNPSSSSSSGGIFSGPSTSGPGRW